MPHDLLKPRLVFGSLSLWRLCHKRRNRRLSFEENCKPEFRWARAAVGNYGQILVSSRAARILFKSPWINVLVLWQYQKLIAQFIIPSDNGAAVSIIRTSVFTSNKEGI